MKLINLNEAPLDGLKQGVEVLRKNAQAIIEFDENWDLVNTVINSNSKNLSIIAVLGPSPIGIVSHLEVGFRTSLPYLKANKCRRRQIIIYSRYKVMDLETDWGKVIPVLADVMNKMAIPIIKSWSGWAPNYARQMHFVRSFRTKLGYKSKWWTPPKPGISFHISEYDKELVDVFYQASLSTNRRFLEKMRGVLGVIYVVQRHFDLYQVVNKKRRLKIIREVIDDSSIPEMLRCPDTFEVLMSVSIRHLGRDIIFPDIEEFVTFLKNANYLSPDLWRRYLNFASDIKKRRAHFKEKSKYISDLTSDIQIDRTAKKIRAISKFVDGKPTTAKADFFSFKVYDNPVEKQERTFFDDNEKDEGVPF